MATQENAKGSDGSTYGSRDLIQKQNPIPNQLPIILPKKEIFNQPQHGRLGKASLVRIGMGREPKKSAMHGPSYPRSLRATNPKPQK